MVKNKEIISYCHLGWIDFNYTNQYVVPPVGTTEYEKIKEELIKNDCQSAYKMLEDYNRPLTFKSFSEMYERLTKKIEKMVEDKKEYYKYSIGITAPGIDAAILVNSIAAKYGIFNVFAVKNDIRFKFPKDYVAGDNISSDYEKLIGCSYKNLYEHNIYNIYFFNSEIELELDPAQQLRAGLIKR